MAGAGYRVYTTGDVLTAAQVNNYLQEQTVMRFASAAARTSALTAVLAEGMMSYLVDTNAVEVYDGANWVSVGSTGDITGVTAGTGITGGGTSGTVTITNSMATEIDAKGDLIAGTGADAFARLAVGTNGQFLKADSAAATGLTWATSGAGNLAFQDFTSSGTFTVPTGVTNALIFACGGGGGSGGATSGASGRQASGGGGGGGDVVLQPVAVTSGASITVTIGAGGTAGVAANGAGGVGGNTTFGSLLTAAGGGGGGGSNTSATSGTVVSIPNYSAGGGGGGGARGDATNVNGNAGGGGGATSPGTPPLVWVLASPTNYIYTTGGGGGAKGGATGIIYRHLNSAGYYNIVAGNGGVGFYNYGAGGGGAGDNGGNAGGAKAGAGGAGNNGGNAGLANWGGGAGGSGSQDSAVATAGAAGGSGFLRVMWVA